MHTDTYVPDYLTALVVDEADTNDLPIGAAYADVIERGLATIDAMEPAEYEQFRDFHLTAGMAQNAVDEARHGGGRGKVHEVRNARAVALAPLWGNGVTILTLCDELHLTTAEVVRALFGQTADVDAAIAIEADVLAGEVEATSMRKLARKYGGDKMRLVRKACEAHPVSLRGRQAA